MVVNIAPVAAEFWPKTASRSAASASSGEQASLSRMQDDLVDAGDLHGAERLLTTWLEMHPADNHIARLELARIHFWRGRPQRARDLLETLRRERPDDTWVASLLGQLVARFGDRERARALFDQALALDGANHEARLFLGGDDFGHAQQLRRMLTHRELSPRAAIELALLCAALDFRRAACGSSLAEGELTQAALDRANLMMDLAAVGDDVDMEVSLRPALANAERIVLYTSQALGDAVLGLSAVDALFSFFRFHPDLSRQVEIVSPYAVLLQGITERYPQVKLRSACEPRDPDEGSRCADDLRRQRGPLFVLVTSSGEVTSALRAAAREQEPRSMVVDLLVDRYSRDLVPWQCVQQPRRHIVSYPARLHRLFEIMLGCKLTDRPADVIATMSLAASLKRRRNVLLRRYRFAGGAYHCVIESVSKPSKAFTRPLLRGLLCEMAAECAAAERETGRQQRIVFSRDSNLASSFANEIDSLPRGVRARIETIHETLPVMAVILASAQTVVSTDTGLAHVASALGRQTVIAYSVADPFLWSTGGNHVRAVWTPQALSAHTNRTPVNMLEWESTVSLMEETVEVRDLIEAWRRCKTAAAAETGARPVRDAGQRSAGNRFAAGARNKAVGYPAL
jgi:tetratricopeptide (TPR) repeat protein